MQGAARYLEKIKMDMQSETKREYIKQINYIKDLRSHFRKEYASDFIFGSLYQGTMDCSYFSLTTQELKKLKLKFVIIFNHELMRFEICLSGQNKNIRKNYWALFKDSNWSKYPLAKSIDNSLSIIDHTLAEQLDFDNEEKLTEQIEVESLKFINEIRGVLEH